MLLGGVDERQRVNAFRQGPAGAKVDELVACRDAPRDLLDRSELGRRDVDDIPERRIAEAVRQVTDDQAKKCGIPRPRAEGAVKALADGTGDRCSGIDGPRVVVGADVGLHAMTKPFCRTAQAIEVRVADDGVDGTDAIDDFRGDHLRTSPVLSFCRQHEAGVAPVAFMHRVVVVIHPPCQTRAELLDEWQRNLIEATTRGLGGKGHVQHDDAAREISCPG